MSDTPAFNMRSDNNNHHYVDVELPQKFYPPSQNPTGYEVISIRKMTAREMILYQKRQKAGKLTDTEILCELFSRLNAHGITQEDFEDLSIEGFTEIANHLFPKEEKEQEKD